MYQGNTNWIMVLSYAQERAAQKQRALHRGQEREPVPPSPPTPHTQHSHLAAASQGASMGYKGSFYQKITTWFKN